MKKENKKIFFWFMIGVSTLLIVKQLNKTTPSNGTPSNGTPSNGTPSKWQQLIQDFMKYFSTATFGNSTSLYKTKRCQIALQLKNMSDNDFVNFAKAYNEYAAALNPYNFGPPMNENLLHFSRNFYQYDTDQCSDERDLIKNLHCRYNDFINDIEPNVNYVIPCNL